MQRFFGMMPQKEVTIQGSYVDGWGMKMTIQAGPNGWTILYSDGSSDWCDEVNEDTVNFQKAYDIANESVGPLTKNHCADEV